MKNRIKNKLVDARYKASLGVLLLVVVLNVLWVDSNLQERDTPTSIEDVQLQIITMKKDLKILQERKELDAVEKYWRLLERISVFYGLKVTPVNSNAKEELYKGSLSSLHGRIEGDKKQVLSALIDIQKHLPVRFYKLEVLIEEMKVTFSVLGAKYD